MEQKSPQEAPLVRAESSGSPVQVPRIAGRSGLSLTMLSFIVPARSQPEETRLCIDSILHCIRTLGVEAQSEFILLDDQSEPQLGLEPRIFRPLRGATSAKVFIARFRTRQHYTGVLSYGLSRASGDNVFFVSNDMFMTPSWLRTVLAVAALKSSYGIIRGTAEVVDSHPEHQFSPPFETSQPAQWLTFSQYMSEQFGLLHSIDKLLSADAVLIKRAVLEKIGTADPRTYSYFGDLDLGLRAQRAGFDLVCAKGAWIRHHGQGYIRAEMQHSQAPVEQAAQQRMAIVQQAYAKFKAKWNAGLPEQFTSTDSWDFDRLRNAPLADGEFVTPLPVETGGAVVS